MPTRIDSPSKVVRIYLRRKQISYSSPLKIAILSDNPSLYEDTMYLKELERRLTDKGFHSKVFLVNSRGAFSKIDSPTGLLRMLNSSMLVNKLCKYDILDVQFTFPIGFPLAVLSSMKLLRKPIVIHTHGYDVFTVPNLGYGVRRTSMGRFMTNFAWRHSRNIISVCKKSKSELLKAGVDSDKIDVVYNGVDESLFSPVEPILDDRLLRIRNESDIIFLSVASIIPIKNQQRLIEVFRRVIKQYDSKVKVKLLLIGNQPEHSPVRIKANGDIIYLGKKPHLELPVFYNMADAFILPSITEAHPWSLLEAMSCQLPVLASNVGGIPETIDNQFLLDPLSEKDISNKCEKIIEMSKKERKSIGFSNREVILRSFTLQKHITTLSGIFQRIIEGNRGSTQSTS